MDKNEINHLEDLASIGNVDAIISLSNYYLESGDEAKAFLVAQRLEFISSTVGYKVIASYYLKGVGTKQDLHKAKSLYKKSYDLGDFDSGYNLALIYIKEDKISEAMKYLTLGVSENHIPSIKLLASLYTKGEVVSKNLDVAINLLNKSLSLGDKSSAEVLGKLYYSRGEYEEAFKCFSIGAELKDLDSIYHLAVCYAKGLGVKQDFSLARKYYEIGANLLEPRCLYNLSLYYRNGITIDKNIELANKLERQAIDNGFKK